MNNKKTREAHIDERVNICEKVFFYERFNIYGKIKIYVVVNIYAASEGGSPFFSGGAKTFF